MRVVLRDYANRVRRTRTSWSLRDAAPVNAGRTPRIYHPWVTSTTCGWCQCRSQMIVMTEQIAVETRTVGRNKIIEAAFQCVACGHLSIAIVVADPRAHTDRLDWSGGKWVPSGRPAIPPMYTDSPAQIGAAALEAHQCHEIGAQRASILLARSVIEATAKAHKITEGMLLAKIDMMERRGVIRAATAEAAHEVRLFGNDMAHGDFGEEPHMDETEEVLAVMGEILNESFEGPARLARLRERREVRKATPKPD